MASCQTSNETLSGFLSKTYGLFEVIGGTAKILFLATAIVIMGAINGGGNWLHPGTIGRLLMRPYIAGPNHAIGRSSRETES